MNDCLFVWGGGRREGGGVCTVYPLYSMSIIGNSTARHGTVRYGVVWHD